MYKRQDQVIVQSIGLTPIARASSLGVAITFSPKWQASADYRISSVTGTIATPTLPASEATGNIRTTSAQLIGCLLYTSRCV